MPIKQNEKFTKYYIIYEKKHLYFV